MKAEQKVRTLCIFGEVRCITFHSIALSSENSSPILPFSFLFFFPFTIVCECETFMKYIVLCMGLQLPIVVTVPNVWTGWWNIIDRSMTECVQQLSHHAMSRAYLMHYADYYNAEQKLVNPRGQSTPLLQKARIYELKKNGLPFEC